MTFNFSTLKWNKATNNISHSTVDEIYRTLCGGAKIGPLWEDINTDQINLLTAENAKGVCYFAVKCDNSTKTISQRMEAKTKPTFAFCEYNNPNTYTLIWIFDRLISGEEHSRLRSKFANSTGFRVVYYDSFVGADTMAIEGLTAFNTGVVYSPETLLNPSPKGSVKIEVTNPEASEQTGSKVTLQVSEGVTKSRLQIQSDEATNAVSDVTPSNTSDLGGVKIEVTTYTLPEHSKNTTATGYIPSSNAHEEIEPVEVEQSKVGYAPLTGFTQFDELQITQDLANMGVTEFADFIRGLYPYYDRTDFAGRDYIDTTKEDYIEIYREGCREERTTDNGNTIVEYTPSIIVGKKRTSYLYTSAVKRRLINPNVEYAQLLANLVEDVVRYYDYTTDNVLSPREIARTAARVMMMTSKQLKGVNIPKDTRKIVTNPELTNRKSVARIAKGEITNGVYARTYDESKTDTQIADEMGVSEWTARTHRKLNDIPSKGERTRMAFAALYDATLSNAQMLDRMTESGYPISLRTLQRLKAIQTTANKASGSVATPKGKETIIQTAESGQRASQRANQGSGVDASLPMKEETPQASENKAAGSVETPQMVNLSTQEEKTRQMRPDEATEPMTKVECISVELEKWQRSEYNYNENPELESVEADNAANSIAHLIGEIKTVGELNWCDHYINKAFEVWGWVLGNRFDVYFNSISRQLQAKRIELEAA